MDYSTYTACLSAYHRLEQSDDKKLYTHRYRQFLLQVFSADSVLPLVPNAAIQLLQKYSEGGPPDPRLQPLIPALGMIFLNAYHLINNQYSGMGSCGFCLAHLPNEQMSFFIIWSTIERL